ncbi:uncharacterized protein LOC129752493 [Uranotaenia lowii]|uniref:uncharacterized protein LOC129752493 n=1 Tax=Uranotaenia lowii TaxID=190385 RepID=UPI002479B143|nr:uncharacterized protein LOC129752493 [Uranotaenia lowii]
MSRFFTTFFCLALTILLLPVSALPFIDNNWKQSLNPKSFKYETVNGLSDETSYWMYSCQLNTACSMNCKDVHIGKLSTEIYFAYDVPARCFEIDLYIENLLIDNGTLFPGWLNLDAKINLRSLILIECHIEVIEPESFNSREFFNLISLYMSHLNISELKSSTFVGLSRPQFWNL